MDGRDRQADGQEDGGRQTDFTLCRTLSGSCQSGLLLELHQTDRQAGPECCHVCSHVMAEAVLWFLWQQPEEDAIYRLRQRLPEASGASV